MSDDNPIPLRGGGVIYPAAPWPLPDRRQMQFESSFGRLDEPRRIAVMEQAAAILREAKDKRHEAIRQTLMKEQEQA